MADRTILFFGESFRVHSGDDCEWAFMEFADAAAGIDVEQNPLPALAATMQVLQAVVVEDDWARFKATARKNRARTERDLMPILKAVFEAETGRPTGLPSDSSGGQPGTALNSEEGSSSQVIDRFLEAGRPSLALIVSQAQEYSVSA